MEKFKTIAIVRNFLLIGLGLVGYLVPTFVLHLRWICILMGILGSAKLFLRPRKFSLGREKL